LLSKLLSLAGVGLVRKLVEFWVRGEQEIKRRVRGWEGEIRVFFFGIMDCGLLLMSFFPNGIIDGIFVDKINTSFISNGITNGKLHIKHFLQSIGNSDDN